MEGGGGMSVVKCFSEKEARVVGTMLLLYLADKIAIVDEQGGELHAFGFREYVDGKAEVLSDILKMVENEI